MLTIARLIRKIALNLWLRLFSFPIAGGGSVGRGSWIVCNSWKIGPGTGIGWWFVARGAGSLEIGKYCAIGQEVRIVTSNHDYRCLSINLKLQDLIVGERAIDPKRVGVSIGHDVWIGDRVIILPGVSISSGAIIAAGAVVTKNVAPYEIVGGCPARTLGFRFQEAERERLIALEWWDWPLEKMKDNKSLFTLGGVDLINSAEKPEQVKNGH